MRSITTPNFGQEILVATLIITGKKNPLPKRRVNPNPVRLFAAHSNSCVLAFERDVFATQKFFTCWIHVKNVPLTQAVCKAEAGQAPRETMEFVRVLVGLPKWKRGPQIKGHHSLLSGRITAAKWKEPILSCVLHYCRFCPYLLCSRRKSLLSL